MRRVRLGLGTLEVTVSEKVRLGNLELLERLPKICRPTEPIYREAAVAQDPNNTGHTRVRVEHGRVLAARKQPTSHALHDPIFLVGRNGYHDGLVKTPTLIIEAAVHNAFPVLALPVVKVCVLSSASIPYFNEDMPEVAHG